MTPSAKVSTRTVPVDTIYVLSITEAAKIPAAWCEEQFPRRMERARKFRREEDRLRCIAAGALEVYALGVRESGIVLDERGKPTAPERGVFFSVSHSGDYAVLALSDREVGTDIEKIEDARLAVAERVFTPEELLWMREDAQERFYILWTLKESVSKLDGRGLSLPMESCSVLPMIRGESILLDGKRLFGTSQRFANCILSLCSAEKAERIELNILTAGEILGK